MTMRGQPSPAAATATDPLPTVAPIPTQRFLSMPRVFAAKREMLTSAAAEPSPQYIPPSLRTRHNHCEEAFSALPKAVTAPEPNTEIAPSLASSPADER